MDELKNFQISHVGIPNNTYRKDNQLDLFTSKMGENCTEY